VRGDVKGFQDAWRDDLPAVLPSIIRKDTDSRDRREETIPEKWLKIKENELVSGRGVEPRTHGVRVCPGGWLTRRPPTIALPVLSVLPVMSPLPSASVAGRL
jgi:hypothetical protein